MTWLSRPSPRLAAISMMTLGGLAGQALAEAPAPRPAPQVEVTQDGHTAGGVIKASIDIDAPPEAVWQVLVNCAAAPRLMVNLKTCRVIDRDPAGHWDVRETISRGALLPGIRVVMRADYDRPNTIRFHRVDGDLRVLEGEWRLTSIDGGAETHLTYESRVAGPFAAPGFLLRGVLRHDMPVTLVNLRAACETPTAVATAHP